MSVYKMNIFSFSLLRDEVDNSLAAKEKRRAHLNTFLPSSFFLIPIFNRH